MHVLDIDNGARFETYTIAGERGSGAMQINGAAARLVHRGDTIIVVSYAHYDQAELERYEPRVVHVEADTNRIITVDDGVATLLRIAVPSARGVNLRQRKHMSSRPDPTTPGRGPPRGRRPTQTACR